MGERGAGRGGGGGGPLRRAAALVHRALSSPYTLLTARLPSSDFLHLPPALCLCLCRSTLVEAIRPHLAALRGTPHGKRILAKVAIKL